MYCQDAKGRHRLTHMVRITQGPRWTWGSADKEPYPLPRRRAIIAGRGQAPLEVAGRGGLAVRSPRAGQAMGGGSTGEVPGNLRKDGDVVGGPTTDRADPPIGGSELDRHRTGSDAVPRMLPRERGRKEPRNRQKARMPHVSEHL